MPVLDTTWLVELYENEYRWADTEVEALRIIYCDS